MAESVAQLLAPTPTTPPATPAKVDDNNQGEERDSTTLEAEDTILATSVEVAKSHQITSTPDLDEVVSGLPQNPSTGATSSPEAQTSSNSTATHQITPNIDSEAAPLSIPATSSPEAQSSATSTPLHNLTANIDNEEATTSIRETLSPEAQTITTSALPPQIITNIENEAAVPTIEAIPAPEAQSINTSTPPQIISTIEKGVAAPSIAATPSAEAQKSATSEPANAPPHKISPRDDYFQIGEKKLINLLQERGVPIPDKVKKIEDSRARRDRLAIMLQGKDAEDAAGGLTVDELTASEFGPRTVTSDTSTIAVTKRIEETGAVIREIFTTTTTRIITSVRAGTTLLKAPARTPGEDPVTRYAEIDSKDDEYLTRIMLRAQLIPTGNREKDMAAFRRWEKFMQSEYDIVTEKEFDGEIISRATTLNTDILSAHQSKGLAPENAPVVGSEILNDILNAPSATPSISGHIRSQSLSPVPELDQDTSSEPESPVEIDWMGPKVYGTTIKKEILKRDPSLTIPSKMKAAEVKAKYGPKLAAMDVEARAARNKIREGKRAWQEDKEDNEATPSKRIKLSAKPNVKKTPHKSPAKALEEALEEASKKAKTSQKAAASGSENDPEIFDVVGEAVNTETRKSDVENAAREGINNGADTKNHQASIESHDDLYDA